MRAANDCTRPVTCHASFVYALPGGCHFLTVYRRDGSRGHAGGLHGLTRCAVVVAGDGGGGGGDDMGGLEDGGGGLGGWDQFAANENIFGVKAQTWDDLEEQ